MGSVVILLELESSTEVLDAGEVDVGARVRWVHAAAEGGARTLCGLDTAPLEYEPYRPGGPDEPWYPPQHGTRRCQECDAALGAAGG
ncbi:hypothetical protein P3T36_006669 [Kitasatospora sp. MAP12-15]|uniref:hypothetical protein n=1 Tax=unclassified Kitasatospora TaxID=2633591 RepID=UPI002474BD5B|nr:hypothetical protein [Kitasatospora sp. MAP12-44]MDH6110173.1 hypothetical protein [Kitasatospora sp. MAP12-44]